MNNINQNLIEEIKKTMPKELVSTAVQLIKEIEGGRRTTAQMENAILEDISDLVED